MPGEQRVGEGVAGAEAGEHCEGYKVAFLCVAGEIIYEVLRAHVKSYADISSLAVVSDAATSRTNLICYLSLKTNHVRSELPEIQTK